MNNATAFACPKVTEFKRPGDVLPTKAIQFTDDNKDEVLKFGPENTIVMGDKLYVEVTPEHFGWLEKGYMLVKEGRCCYSIWSVKNFLNVHQLIPTA